MVPRFLFFFTVAGEHGGKVSFGFALQRGLEAHQPCSSVVGCRGACMGSALGAPWPLARWGLQRHLAAILRPGCLAQAAGKDASCPFQLFWHFKNAHPSLKLHFKVFNPSVGCVLHA